MSLVRLFLMAIALVSALTACSGGGGGGDNAGAGPASGSGGGANGGINWSGPASLGAPTVGSDGWGQPMRPNVLMDAGGNVTAVWYRWDGVAVSLWASHRPAAGAWSTPVRIENTDQDAVCRRAVSNCDRHTPAVIDADGVVTVAWPSWDGSAWRLGVNRYTPGTGWGTPTLMSAAGPILADLNLTSNDAITVDDAGRVSVFWNTHFDASGKGWMAHFDGTSWSATEVSPRPLSTWATHAASGEHTVVWSDSATGVLARRFKPGEGLEASGQVIAGVGSSGVSAVAYDTSGTVTAVVAMNAPNFTVYGTRRAPGQPWQATTTVATFSQTNYNSPVPTIRLATTASGGAMAVIKWRPFVRSSLEPGTEPMRLNHFDYSAAAGWEQVQNQFCCSMDTQFGPLDVFSTDSGIFVIEQGPSSYTSTAGGIKAYRVPSLPGGQVVYDLRDNSNKAKVAAQPNGHVAIAYALREGIVKVKRHVPGQGWIETETVAALSEPEAARPGVPIDAVTVSPSGHVFVLYYDVDYDAYAGVYYDPASGWAPAGMLTGRSQRVFFSGPNAGAAVMNPNGEVAVLTNLGTAGPGLQAFSGRDRIDIPYSTTIMPRTKPVTSTGGGGGTVDSGDAGGCSGTNFNPPALRNYTTTHYNYIRACGNAEVQIGSLVTGADVYYDDYVEEITVHHCDEKQAYDIYAAHQDVSLLAKRTADTLGCSP